MKRVLVTGATGFLGSHLMERLLPLSERNQDLVVLGVGRSVPKPKPCAACGHNLGPMVDSRYASVDLTYQAAVHDLLWNFNPDTIFHLAANPNVKADEDDPFGIQATNVLSTHYLLEYAPANCRFVFASSATVYGDQYQITRRVQHESCPTYPTSVYGATKVAGESLVEAYTKQGRVRGINLRLIANVGRNATHGILRDLVAKAKSGSPTLQVLGAAPGAIKPFMHADDTAGAMLAAALKPEICETYNVATKDRTNVNEIAHLVLYHAKNMGWCDPSVTIEWMGANSTWVGDNKEVRVTHEDFWDAFNWKPKFRMSQEAIVQALKEMS